MSALGQKQTFAAQKGMSALPPKADIAGVIRSLPFPVHAHTLRHACGYALANKGIDTRTLQASRPPEHSVNGALHRACTGAV